MLLIIVHNNKRYKELNQRELESCDFSMNNWRLPRPRHRLHYILEMLKYGFFFSYDTVIYRYYTV